MKKVMAVFIAIILAFCAGFVVSALDLVHFGDPNRVDIKILKEEVANVSEIASLKCATVERGEISNSKQIAKKIDIPFTGKKLTAECTVITKLGCDLANADIAVSDDQSEITVIIPHSQILSMEIDEDSWTLVNNKSGLFNRTTVEDDDQLRKDVKKAAEERAKADNYYGEADNNAAQVIKDLLTAAYPDKTVKVEFK